MEKTTQLTHAINEAIDLEYERIDHYGSLDHNHVSPYKPRNVQGCLNPFATGVSKGLPINLPRNLG